MKAKIFAKLKQEYASLGLGDEALLSRAEALAATGLVTDDNIDAVVAVQRADLEGQQRRADKRVTDALEKERKKVAEETSKREQEAKTKREKEEAEKKAAEEKAQAEKEEAERLAQEAAQAAQSAPKPADGDNAPDPRFQALEQQIKNILNSNKRKDDDYAKSLKSLTESNQQLLEKLEAITKQAEQNKAEQARQERVQKITAKAKELGVPDWRIKEGFVIADEADDDAITATLTTVANNINTNLLPQGGAAPLVSAGKPSKAEIDSIASAIIR